MPAGRTCLTEALTAQHLVRRRGGDAELRLGVTRGSDGTMPETFMAHAWLEAAGRIIIGGETAAICQPLAIPREMT
jgi:hypothetical protein